MKFTQKHCHILMIVFAALFAILVFMYYKDTILNYMYYRPLTEHMQEILVVGPNDNDNIKAIQQQQLVIDPATATVVDQMAFDPTDDLYSTAALVVPNLQPNSYFLDDGQSGELSIQNDMCSKSCCSDQYPVPHMLKADPYICANKDKFTTSGIMCNTSSQDSGCLCLTKQQGKFLQSRGNNGNTWY